MKKYALISIVFVFAFIIFSTKAFAVFGIKTPVDFSANTQDQKSTGTSTQTYYTGTKIIKSLTSSVFGYQTKATVSLDFSDDTYNTEGQEFHLSVVETDTKKEITSADVKLTSDKFLRTNFSGLTPEKNYTLFIEPKVNGTLKKSYASIAFYTYNPALELKYSSYRSVKSNDYQIINVIIDFQGVPEGATGTFDITTDDSRTSVYKQTPSDIQDGGTRTKYTYTSNNFDPKSNYKVNFKLLSSDGSVLKTVNFDQPTISETDYSNRVGSNSSSKDSYQFLTTIPGLDALCEAKDNKGNCIQYKQGGFGEYLNILIKLTYGIIALIAVFQIVYYGVTYMLTATPFLKSTAKERVYNAIIGIIIALSSWLILYTINPNLVSVNVNGPKVDIVNKNDLFNIAIESYSTDKLDSEALKKIEALPRFDDYYSWPVSGSTIVSQKIHYSRGNESVDIIAADRKDGADIVSAADGVVQSALFTNNCVAGTSGALDCGGGYGNFLEIKHSNNTKTAYAHMKEISVKAGDSVKKGTKIGTMGTTGNSTGPHLHFEVIGARMPLSFLNR